MIKPRVGSYAVYEPPEEGWQDWQEKLQQVNGALQQAGLEVIEAPEAVKDIASCERVADWFQGQQLDLLHALIITWSFDHYTIIIQNKLNVPVAIRSIPGIRTGSLVGGQQLSCILEDLQAEHKLFYAPLEDSGTIDEIAVYAKACAIRSHLRGANLAVIGRRTEGMTATTADEVEILHLFGVRLLPFGLDELYDLRERVPLAEAENLWQKIAAGASQVTSRHEDGVNCLRNYLTLKQMIQELNLQAVTIGSYPKCQGTMCLPIALLNDEGFPTSCEGDVNSAIAMLILSMLTDQPLHFGEMLEVDETANSIVSSHCGCGSPSLASREGYILCPVRLVNEGVCVRFAARPGPVTYVNLVGRKGNYRMCAIEGEAIPTELVFEGNPMRFVLKSPFRKSFKEIVRHGFGHHWMTAYTHAAPVLKEYCQLVGILGIFPDLD